MKLSIVALLAILIFSLASSAATPTFNKDIAPILYQNCASCHRPGEVAPFSLLTYQDASKRAKLISTVTERRYMPPWKAEADYGKFLNERRLTDTQIALIKEWADAGAPEGNAADKPAVPVFTDGWQNGKPDKILTVGSKFSLAADGPDQFQCFVIPLGLDHDTFVRSMEFRPDNRRIVHHVLVFLDTSGIARTRAARNGGSYPCFGGPGIPAAGLIGGWAPGALPPPPDEDNARPVPQGADLVVQIHYHPSGKVEMDQSSLGLLFSSKPPKKGRTAALVLAPSIDIPAGDAHYVVKGQIVLPRDVEMVAIAPHSHYLGKEMKITAQLPDGSTVPLIWIKDWDFNWQGAYFYEKPFMLPKDTRIDLEYTFDNSENNPRNPTHPPVRVKWGEQTTDEMALAFLGISLPTPADAEAFQRQMTFQYLEAFLYEGVSVDNLPSEIPPAQRQALSLAFLLFDRNGNGKLDADEREPLLNLLRSQVR